METTKIEEQNKLFFTADENEFNKIIPKELYLSSYPATYKRLAKQFEGCAINIIKAIYDNLDKFIPNYTGDLFIELKLSLLDNVGISKKITELLNQIKRRKEKVDHWGYIAMKNNEVAIVSKTMYQLTMENGKWKNICVFDVGIPEAYEHFVYQKELYDDITTCFKSNNTILKSAKSEIYMEEAPVFTFHYIMEVDDKLLHDNIFKNFYQKYKY